MHGISLGNVLEALYLEIIQLLSKPMHLRGHRIAQQIHLLPDLSHLAVESCAPHLKILQHCRQHEWMEHGPLTEHYLAFLSQQSWLWHAARGVILLLCCRPEAHRYPGCAKPMASPLTFHVP